MPASRWNVPLTIRHRTSVTDPLAILSGHYSRRVGGRGIMGRACGELPCRVFFVGDGGRTPEFVLKAVAETECTAAWRQTLALHAAVAIRHRLVAPLVPTDDGADGVCSDGLIWRLMVYLPGAPFRGSQAERRAAAESLARLHVAMRTMDGGPSISRRYTALSASERTAVLASTAPNAEAAPFWSRVRQLVGGELPRLVEEIHAIDDDATLPVQLVHRDFHPGNVLFDGRAVSGIIDLDSLATDFRMQAVAFAASRFEGTEAGSFDAFIRAYHTVDPLQDQELALAGHFVRREAARRLHWIIRTNVLEGGNAWRHDLEKHARELGIASPDGLGRPQCSRSAEDADAR